MGRELRLIKATEFPPERLSRGSFQRALEEGIIDATLDAREVLLALDARITKGLRGVSANDDELPRSRYVLVSIRQPRNMEYVIQYSLRLLKSGWTLFLNHGALLAFVSGGFREIVPLSCDEVSVPLQLDGKLKAMTVKLKGSIPLIDLHPLEFETKVFWRGDPLDVGEKVLLLR